MKFRSFSRWPHFKSTALNQESMKFIIVWYLTNLRNFNSLLKISVSFSFICLVTSSHCKVIELKCNPNYDVAQIVNLPYRCINGLACFFEHIHVDENTNLVLNFDE